MKPGQDCIILSSGGFKNRGKIVSFYPAEDLKKESVLMTAGMGPLLIYRTGTISSQ